MIELIGEISKEGDIEYIESILYYVIERADTEEIDNIFSGFKEAVAKEHKEVVMTIAERLEQRGREVGIQIGIEKGRQEGRREIVINMLSKGLDEKVITESTGLSIEEIKRLKN